MTSTETLREEVRQYIEHADDKSLRMVKAVLEIQLEDDDENWDDLPEELKTSIDKAITEGQNGKGIPHEQVVEKYSKWFRK